MTNPLRPPTPSVAVVLPLHRLDENGCPVFVRRRGRQRRIERVPTISEAHYHAAIADAVEHAIEQDELVGATLKANPKEVLEKTMVAVAQEAASLLWERERAQREGRAEAERISSRRVASLCRLADLVLVHEEMRRADPELDPQDVAKVLGMILSDAEEVIAGVAPPDVAAKFLGSIRARMAAADMPCGTTP